MYSTDKDVLCMASPLFLFVRLNHSQATFLHYSIALISSFNFLPFPLATHYVYTIRLVLGNLAAWTHGACIVYPSEIFNPEAIVDAVVEEECTALHGVPTHFLGVLAEVQKRRQLGDEVNTSKLR
jgi:hypothetical protein